MKTRQNSRPTPPPHCEGGGLTIQKSVDSVANRPVTDALPWLSWNKEEWSGAEDILTELENATFAVQRRTYMLDWLHDHDDDIAFFQDAYTKVLNNEECDKTRLRLHARHHLTLQRDILKLANVEDREAFFNIPESDKVGRYMMSFFDPEYISQRLEEVPDYKTDFALCLTDSHSMERLEWLAANTDIGIRLAAVRESELNRLGSLVNRLYNYFYNHEE